MPPAVAALCSRSSKRCAFVAVASLNPSTRSVRARDRKDDVPSQERRRRERRERRRKTRKKDLAAELEDDGAARRVRSDPAGATAATLEAMAARADVIYQAPVADATFLGVPDFLVRRDDGSYAIWDAKLSRRAAPNHVMQLCCYAELLGASGRRVDAAGLVLGGGDPLAGPGSGCGGESMFETSATGTAPSTHEQVLQARVREGVPVGVAREPLTPREQLPAPEFGDGPTAGARSVQSTSTVSYIIAIMQLVVLVGILQRNCTFTTTIHIHFFKKG